MSSKVDLTIEEKGVVIPPAPTNDEETATDKPSISNRLGLVSALLFLASFLVLAGAFSFLAFLWFSPDTNTSWRQIVLTDWMTRSISFTSTAIRFCISTQTALCLAMLASLALEKFWVSHSDVAAVSIMRIGGSGFVGTCRDLILPLVFRGPRRNFKLGFLVFLTIMILLTSSFFQFTSTILLSDLSVQTLAGEPVETFDIHFNYGFFASDDPNVGGSHKYLRTGERYSQSHPLLHPTFAEYHEPENRIDAPGVSDTGPTIRSFLPIASSQDRGMIFEYIGKAVVLDLRVTCVQPIITDFKWDFIRKEGQDPVSVLEGYVEPDPDLVQGHMLVPSNSTPFNCYGGSSASQPDFISICELQNTGLLTGDETLISGGLQSSFRDSESGRQQSGGAFLIMSNAEMTGTEWVDYTQEASISNWGLDPKIDFDTVFFTLCYTALDSVDRRVKAFSHQNRTEPVPHWHGEDPYRQEDVIQQLIPTVNFHDAEFRGVMHLELDEEEEWVHPLSSETMTDGPIDLDDAQFAKRGDSKEIGSSLPWLIDCLHWSPTSDSSPNNEIGNSGILLSTQTPQHDWTRITGVQTWLIEMFHAFLPESQGGTAQALQSFFSLIAGLQYYTRLSEYDKATTAMITSYSNHLAPRPPYNWNIMVNRTVIINGQLFDQALEGEYTWKHKVPPFLTITIAVAIIHSFVVIAIFAWFLKASKFTRLGDPWQAVSHVVAGDDMFGILDASSNINTDRAAATKRIDELGQGDTYVGLVSLGGGKVALEKKRKEA